MSDDPKPNSPEDLAGPLGNTPPPPREGLKFPIPPSAPQRSCSTCKAPIFWIETARGRRMPVDPDGTSHFATCVHANHHRKKS